MVFVLLLTALDVTTPAAKKQTLLQYVASREDLSAAEQAEWDKALRIVFGGKAMREGGDAVGAAKSVISAGIFFRLPVRAVAGAAYEAHNDVLSWVPPPVAIQYQLLMLQGRAPREGARLMAFNFPKYYSDELAAEFVTWWADRLAAGEVNPGLVPQVERQVAQTRLLMRPMMREKLFLLAELEARLSFHDDADLRAQIKALRAELARDFVKVAQSPRVYDPGVSTYERYVALSSELRLTALPPPATKPAVTTTIEPPAKKAGPQVAPTPDRTESGTRDGGARDGGARDGGARDGGARDGGGRAEAEPRSGRGMRAAPLVGDPLIAVDAQYDDRVDASVSGWLGTPYLYGGETKRGIDCSAFVREVYRESQQVELPRSSVQQAAVGLAVPAAQLVPGDIVLFDILERGRVSHVGVFVGDGWFAHASSSRGVVRDKLGSSWAQRALRGSRRLLTAADR